MSWQYDVMAFVLWCYGVMAIWCHGNMMSWHSYYGVMESWHYSVVPTFSVVVSSLFVFPSMWGVHSVDLWVGFSTFQSITMIYSGLLC